MSSEIPVRPQDVSAAFLSELVGELRPGVTVETVDIVGVKGYGEADTTHSVSTSTQATFGRTLRWNWVRVTSYPAISQDAGCRRC